jgi:N-acyl-D-aspartate/D-glutamate deacylase
MKMHHPTRFAAAALLLATQAACGGSDAPPAPVDILIRGGTVYNGDDLAPTVADVGVTGDRIVFVGKAAQDQVVGRVIEATGMVVAPGFIDAHTHADGDLLSEVADKRLNLPFVTQGVTTAVIGNDGYGSYDIAGQAERLRLNPPGTNVAMFVGFGPVRQSQLGNENKAPDAAQTEAMQALVARAMCQGAIGFSTGLYYTPQNFSATEEVIAVARAAAVHGGLYDSHIRDEQTATGLPAAVAEALRIGREAGMPVHLAHIKALGADAKGKSAEIIAMVEAAQAAGQKVTADQYPWLASSTLLSAALIPPWANAGGRAALLARLDDPAVQARLHADIAENLRLRYGAEAVLIAAGNPKYVGRTIAQIAQAAQVGAVDAVVLVLRESDNLIANFNQGDDDVRAFMARPWVGTSSDSSAGHPRAVGSFAQKYAEYVVRQQHISLGQFVRSSTAFTADALGIAERGRLRAGHFADIVVFDPARFAARATYTAPTALSTGVVLTMVNGQAVVENDVPRRVAAGRALLRAPRAGLCPAPAAAAAVKMSAALDGVAHDHAQCGGGSVTLVHGPAAQALAGGPLPARSFAPVVQVGPLSRVVVAQGGPQP